MTRELPLDQAPREPRGIDRNRNFVQDVVNGADMVFVPVGDDEPQNLIRPAP